MKIHYLIDVEPATEADTEGVQAIACGRESVEKYTRHKSMVTCANCVRALLSPSNPESPPGGAAAPVRAVVGQTLKDKQ